MEYGCAELSDFCWNSEFSQSNYVGTTQHARRESNQLVIAAVSLASFQGNRKDKRINSNNSLMMLRYLGNYSILLKF